MRSIRVTTQNHAHGGAEADVNQPTSRLSAHQRISAQRKMPHYRLRTRYSSTKPAIFMSDPIRSLVRSSSEISIPHLDSTNTRNSITPAESRIPRSSNDSSRGSVSTV